MSEDRGSAVHSEGGAARAELGERVGAALKGREKRSSWKAIQRSIVVLTCCAFIIQTGFLITSISKQADALEVQNRALRLQVDALAAQKSDLSARILDNPDLINRHILDVLIAYPELRKYFYGGASVDALRLRLGGGNDTELRIEISRAETVAEMFLDFIESFVNPYYSDIPQMQKGASFREAWDGYFRDLFGTSPEMCRMYRSKSDWWVNPDFVELVKVCKETNATILDGP